MKTRLGVLVALLIAVIAATGVRAAMTPGYTIWQGVTSLKHISLDRGIARPNSQCIWKPYRVMNGATPTDFRQLCVVDTNWGVLSKDGYAQTNPFASLVKIQLPGSREILPVAATDRLYFSEYATEGHIRVGYYDDFTHDFFHVSNNVYTTIAEPSYISAIGGNAPQVFRGRVGFSQNGQWLAGVAGNTFMRMRLSDFARSTFGVADDQDAVYTPSISDDGNTTTVSGGNFWKLHVYEMLAENFEELSNTHFIRRDGFIPTVLTDEMIGGQYVSNAVVSADAGEIDLNVVQQGVTNKIRVKPGVDGAWHGLTYLGLGDSYSSGEGAVPRVYMEGTDGSEEYPNEKCHVSTGSYPHRLANLYGLAEKDTFANMACSGSVSSDILFTEDYKYRGRFGQLLGDGDLVSSRQLEAVQSMFPGRAAQADAVDWHQPYIVTIGVGGNDLGFGDVLNRCAQAVNTTCRDALVENRPTAGASIKSQFSKLTSMYRSILEKSPESRLFVVGYPQFIDRGENCSYNVRLDGAERRFIRESVHYLNQVISAAARGVGVAYIDIEDSLRGHALCGKDARAVNGVVMGEEYGVPVAGIDLRFIGQESYHPTSYGHKLIADYISSRHNLLDEADSRCAGFATCPDMYASPPSIPVYFHAADTEVKKTVNRKMIVTVVDKTTIYDVVVSEVFRPGSQVKVTVHSEPRQLGVFSADAEGSVALNFQMPSDLEAGYHTLEVEGVLLTGETIVFEQTIFVGAEARGVGPCGFMSSSGLDEDNDGIDDACDGYIDVENPTTIYSPYDDTVYPETAEEMAVSPDGQVDSHIKTTAPSHKPATNRAVAQNEHLPQTHHAQANSTGAAGDDLSGSQRRDTPISRGDEGALWAIIGAASALLAAVCVGFYMTRGLPKQR